MRVTYENEARQEGMEAAAWYEEQQHGLGIRFLAEWRRAENRMLGNPLIHRCFEGDLRKVRFDVFSFALVFRIRRDDLEVIAVMHMSRNPGYWKERGGDSV